MMRPLEPPGMPKVPRGFARGVEVPRGQRLVRVGGLDNAKEAGEVPQGIAAQAHAQFVNAVVVMAEAGMGLEDVFHVSASVLSRGDLDAYTAVRDQVFARLAVLPTSHVAIVAGLENPQARVCIELWAAAV